MRYCRFDRWRRSRRGLRGLKRRLLPLQDGLEDLTHVLDQVKPVAYLHRVWCATGGTLHIRHTAIPADHFDARMVKQPLREGISRTFREQIDDVVALEVDENSTVDMPFAEGEVVHPQNARGRLWCWWIATGQTQKGVWADRHALPLGEAGTRCTADFKAKPTLLSAQAACPASIGSDEVWQPFAKGEAWARCGNAEETTCVQLNSHGRLGERQVGQRSLVGAVDPAG